MFEIYIIQCIFLLRKIISPPSLPNFIFFFSVPEFMLFSASSFYLLRPFLLYIHLNSFFLCLKLILLSASFFCLRSQFLLIHPNSLFLPCVPEVYITLWLFLICTQFYVLVCICDGMYRAFKVLVYAVTLTLHISHSIHFTLVTTSVTSVIVRLILMHCVIS